MPDETGNLPTSGVEQFALWAIEPEQRDFRLAALEDLPQAIQKYPGGPALSAEEIEFCEGWLYLARKEMAVDEETDLDAALVEKARRHIEDAGQFQTLSG
jgi:hypothetical protein